jgi:hypothetical protein
MASIRVDDLVLVAILKKPRDLEIARVLGWYRIPLAFAPKVVRVDWIAFYQPASFKQDKWAIRYVAPVKGYEMVQRVELLNDEPDHPRAHEPYYKIQLGPLEPLSQPIPSRSWRRFTFLYTTGKRLLQAKDLGDLRVNSSDSQHDLWRILKEREIEYAPGAESMGRMELDA